MTNFKANEKVVLKKSNSEIVVRFHSLSRQRGFAFVTNVKTGKFDHVKLQNIHKEK